MQQGNLIFADGLMDAAVTNGVVRMTLAQQASDGKPLPAGQLLMPLGQLPHFANALVTLLKQIEQRVKDQQQPGVSAAEEPPPAAVPGAFRFG